MDIDQIATKVTELAVARMYEILEGARRDLGEAGEEIMIDRRDLRLVGDKLELGAAKFPSEDVKDRFVAAVRRRTGAR